MRRTTIAGDGPTVAQGGAAADRQAAVRTPRRVRLGRRDRATMTPSRATAVASDRRCRQGGHHAQTASAPRRVGGARPAAGARRRPGGGRDDLPLEPAAADRGGREGPRSHPQGLPAEQVEFVPEEPGPFVARIKAEAAGRPDLASACSAALHGDFAAGDRGRSTARRRDGQARRSRLRSELRRARQAGQRPPALRALDAGDLHHGREQAGAATICRTAPR